MGCDAITETINPKTDRYQTLISLMLSSQTKDAVNFEALANLRLMKPGGLKR
jgi:endonuclease III